VIFAVPWYLPKQIPRYGIPKDKYPYNGEKNGKNYELVKKKFGFWCLTPLSAIFQLYHDDQF
jgi:hypothetical protein